MDSGTESSYQKVAVMVNFTSHSSYIMVPSCSINNEVF